VVVGMALIGATFLAACDPVGLTVGAGATVGLAGAQERGLKGTASDARIYTEINSRWLAQSFDLFRSVGLSVVEGRVLLTGNVKAPDTRVEAVRIAWAVDGVKEVINEIEVTERGGLADSARDAWISTQLKTRLTFDREVQAINYTIDTVNGTVYVIGLAQTDAELDRVINHARNISYVRRVVSHVRLKNDPKRFDS